MSIWTSDLRRLALAAALVLPLAGCMGEATGEDGMALRAKPEAKPLSSRVLTELPLYGGNLVIGAPRGYCLDGSSLRRGVSGSFVLIASCETLSGKPGTVVDPAVMTVSASPRRLGAEQPDAADIAAIMAPAKVLAREDGDGISLVRFASGGDAFLPGGDPRYWRAGMLINGHVVSLAAYTPKGSGDAGYRLILALAEQLRELSPVKDYSPTADDATAPTGGLASLLGGLFPE
ncbi:hypothetical protein [Roseovarius faecimaris]|uniref:hypothetical protein n=1 Tax=Roseovarius faecimaris TaxID=2494550 RepID=UPI0018E04E38|nr:hypothetical protein [Roseovarius faecimaris]